jgi:DNA primase
MGTSSSKAWTSDSLLAYTVLRYAITPPFTAETIDNLLIGFSANEPWREGDQERPGVLSCLTKEPHDFTPRELAATGAFRPTSQDGLAPFFEGRIIFPYWKSGRVVFLIGRRTPWTPDQPWEQGKYKKLPMTEASKVSHQCTSCRSSPCQ